MSTAPDLDKLIAAATPDDQIEIKLVYNARQAARKAYAQKPGADTAKDYESAKGFFNSTMAAMVEKYFPDEAKANEGERFANRKQAYDWIAAQGYKRSRGQFYEDCKAGFPTIHKDGTVSRHQIYEYARQLDVDRRGEAPDLDRDIHEARKLKAQADQEEMKAENMRREMDKEWLHATQAWSAVAAIVGTLLDCLRYEFHAGQGELIHAAAGDMSNGPQTYEAADSIIARAFNAMAASGTIAGTFAKQSTEDVLQ